MDELTTLWLSLAALAAGSVIGVGLLTVYVNVLGRELTDLSRAVFGPGPDGSGAVDDRADATPVEESEAELQRLIEAIPDHVPTAWMELL